MIVVLLILGWMQSLAPGRDHAAVATDIAAVVLEEPPLFRDDEDRVKTASFLTAIAFRESSFKKDAVGDHGNARCLMQLWNAPVEVMTDARLCVRIGMQRLRESMRACGGENPLGTYAAGVGGCTSEKARRISTDRLWLARRLAKGAP